VHPTPEQSGWRPDPTGRYEFRYFNGERWTFDVSVNGQRFIDQGATPNTVHQPGWAPTQPWNRPLPRGFAVAAFVVALASFLIGWVPFVFALGAAGAVTATVFAVIALRRIARNEARGTGFAVAGLLLSVAALGAAVVGFTLTRSVMREFGDFFDAGPTSVSIDRCEQADGLVQLEGTIRNLDETSHSYTINVSYLLDNEIIDSDAIRVPRIDAGEMATFSGSSFVMSVSIGGEFDVVCRIDSVSGPDPFVPNN